MLAEGAARHLKLDEVWWIPARLPPHKEVEGKVSAEDRARMVELAIQGNPAFRVNRLELNRPIPSYTIDTVRDLQQAGPDIQWFFLLGSDTARELPAWREIDELMKRVQFVAVPRPRQGPFSGLPEGIQEIPVETVEISSCELRDRIRRGQPVAGLIPQQVMEYIQKRGLYR